MFTLGQKPEKCNKKVSTIRQPTIVPIAVMQCPIYGIIILRPPCEAANVVKIKAGKAKYKIKK